MKNWAKKTKKREISLGNFTFQKNLFSVD
jgi:hypothetical protein